MTQPQMSKLYYEACSDLHDVIQKVKALPESEFIEFLESMRNLGANYQLMQLGYERFLEHERKKTKEVRDRIEKQIEEKKNAETETDST